MSETQEVKSSKLESEEMNNTEHVEESASSENTPERKKRKKREKGEPTPQELEAQQKLIDVVKKLPAAAIGVFSLPIFLSIIIPYLKCTLPESTYRFFLGMVSCYTPLTNKEIAKIAKCSPRLVSRGRSEVAQKYPPCLYRQRKKGAGRKSKKTDAVMKEIQRYIELRSYGPCTKGTEQYTIATIEGCKEMLTRKGYHLSNGTIYAYFISASIRCRKNKKLLYGNQKTETSAQKALRHAQFDLINHHMDKVDDPEVIVLSVDTKKKEYLGPNVAQKASYTLPGKEPLGGDHDFAKPLDVTTLNDEEDLLQRQEGKAIPYGIYDVELNKGYVNIGITADTPEFVRKSILRFWNDIRQDHPYAKVLILFCDGGGSNSSRCNAFRFQMALLSKKIKMKIIVIHYPPYRSKFNKIERHMFAYISKQFERSQLINLQCVIDLIGSTTTKKGLTIKVELDTGYYQTGQKPSDEQMALFSCEYFGPTKDATKSAKLSYVIDGTMLQDSDVVENTVTVFDLKKNFDLTKEEKERLKEEKQRAKEERAKAKAEKKSLTSNKKKQKKSISSDSKDVALAGPQKQTVA